ncbi:COPII-coated vesicle protein [Trichophyton tonsurans CBS 112818]|uniref:COPII-coated vesicle protein n=1 Tax=Trichophyton tonsurans (strain CBS 112818) TaxID=647933 RepID=F2RZK9_TRIT1|nr:COPII-coated vesicle protein [Trichophyton tonsurans CBS 112818]
MASIQLPLEAFTSRLNLTERLNGIRSQSMSSRFANLRPVSEFLDIKRVSKPANFAEFQSRASYNLSYFSSNYVVVFIVLSIYSLLTNLALLFVILLVLGGSYGIGKLEGRDLDVGIFRATTSQLYTALLVVALPLGLWASPLSTALWLTCATGVGKSQRSQSQLTESESSEEEEEDEDDEDESDGEGEEDEEDPGVSLVPFVGNKRRETCGSERDEIPGEWSESDEDDNTDGAEDSDDENNDDGCDRVTGYDRHELSHNDTIAYAVELAMRDDDDVLVENVLEKIRYARANRLNNFTLTDREVDALERRRRRNAEVGPSRPRTPAINGTVKTPLKGSTRQISSSTKKRRPSDTVSVADTTYSSPAYLGHYSVPASPVPSHVSLRKSSSRPRQPRSSIPPRHEPIFPPLQPPPQPQFYPFGPHPSMMPGPATAGAIPLSVPQSPYPMYPRRAYPPPPPNIMCQPVQATSGTGHGNDGVKPINTASSSKAEGLARRRKSSAKPSPKKSQPASAKPPETPKPDHASPASPTMTETSKSPSSKPTTTATRNGFVRPKRKKYRWI